MASLIVLFLIFQIVSGNEQKGFKNMFHHINTGINFAKDFLGSESVALKVADFVVRAFQPTSRNKQPQSDSYADYSNENSAEAKPNYNINEVPSSMSPLRHLVRLLGLQPNQISAVAVNALIFVAQMITSFIAGPRRPNKPYRSEDLTEWIINKNSRQLQEILKTAKNESLPSMVEELILEKESAEETSCIRLLVCKITPFINRMQQAVFSENTNDYNESVRGAALMYRHLPTSEEIINKSDICERKHKDCNLNERI